MAILESVNELAKRFGVETEEQTISEQIDAINQKLDESYTGSRDIEESVSQFAKNDGPDARLGTKSITENGTYTALDDELDGYSSVTVDVAGGGGETFEVNATLATTDTLTVTIDQDFDDVWEAISAGKKIVGTLTVDSTNTINCVGVSTAEQPGNKAIYLMYEPVPAMGGDMLISVAFGKLNDSMYYAAGYGNYQITNN